MTGGHMKAINIGIYDEERDYVDMLCSFLKEYGKGKWDLAGYTDVKILKNIMEKKSFDLLISTDIDILNQFSKENRDTVLLIFSNEEIHSSGVEDISHIYRFQSARDIAREINMIMQNKKVRGMRDKMWIGVYSPISRCGKTNLSCYIQEKNPHGNYLYFGMEDYCSFEIYSDTGEALYYIKEREKDKFIKLIEESNGKIIMGQGAFENRFLEKEDFIWLKMILKESNYKGFIFDIGSGSVKDITFFYDFDYVFVPVLYEEYCNYKIQNFQKLLKLYEFYDRGDTFVFLDMNDPEEAKKQVEKILWTGENYEPVNR